MNFNNPYLVAKYGSWVKVQVNFYDFLFGIISSPSSYAQDAIEAMSGGFTDGEDFFESSAQKILDTFSSPEAAWEAFLQKNEFEKEIVIQIGQDPESGLWAYKLCANDEWSRGYASNEECEKDATRLAIEKITASTGKALEIAEITRTEVN